MPRAIIISILFAGALLIGSVSSPRAAAEAPAAAPRAKPQRFVKPEPAQRSDGAQAQDAPESGRFRRAPSFARPQVELDEAQLETLRALGYAAGTMEPPTTSGVTIFDRERAEPAFNLLTDGHRAAALLTDMEGRPLHTWALSFEQAFPEQVAPHMSQWSDLNWVSFWRRVHPLPDGELLAIFEGVALIKIDRDSNLLWSFPRVHHDVDVLEDGTIYALTREWEPLPARAQKENVVTDDIVVLDPDGRELKRVSIYRAIRRSPYSALLDDVNRGVERFHTNTIEWLDGSLADKIPAFARGNVLISFRRQNAIAVVDLERKEVVWVAWGMWKKQHQPTVTPAGNILIFDNLGDRGRSRVIEFDPTTQEIVWFFNGGKNGLFSRTCGSNQRLANGNTLITESDAGRALEVTADGKIVWEYITPHRAGENDELIATLFEVIRLPADYPLDWIGKPVSKTHN